VLPDRCALVTILVLCDPRRSSNRGAGCSSKYLQFKLQLHWFGLVMSGATIDTFSLAETYSLSNSTMVDRYKKISKKNSALPFFRSFGPQLHLDQCCPTHGPWAACGSRGDSMWPAIVSHKL